ncbi:MAG: lyase, partial [Gammaproteobacteria bacterium]|nr:lyase [Gammaproteobacteria bacterium]
HTLVQESGPAIWFTAQWSNAVGRLDPRNGKIQQWEMPIERSRPYGIVLDASDMPWIVLLGSNHLAHVASGELVTKAIPRQDARPRRIAMVNGQVWYVDYAQGYLGRFDPASDTFKEWRSPSAEGSRPYGMIADDDGCIWYVETGPQPNRWIGFDTRKERFIVNQVIPDSGGAVRHMFFDAQQNAVWFGMDTNFMGRAELPHCRQ